MNRTGVSLGLLIIALAMGCASESTDRAGEPGVPRDQSPGEADRAPSLELLAWLGKNTIANADNHFLSLEQRALPDRGEWLSEGRRVPRVRNQLHVFLSSDAPDPSLLPQAILAEGFFGDAAETGMVVKFAGRPEQLVRLTAVETLGRLGDPRAFSTLVERAIADDSENVRCAAVISLGAIGMTSRWTVWTQGGIAAAEFRVSDDPAQLRRLLERIQVADSSEFVRSCAQDALEGAKNRR